MIYIWQLISHSKWVVHFPVNSSQTFKKTLVKKVQILYKNELPECDLNIELNSHIKVIVNICFSVSKVKNSTKTEWVGKSNQKLSQHIVNYL